MAASQRDLRRKIKSISGTKKLTQAMQMVAASKMQKAIKSAEMSRDYSRLAWEIIQNIKSGASIAEHPLLIERPTKKILTVLITSNRGLCGGLNAQVIKKFSANINSNLDNKIDIKIITMGNKGKLFVSRYFKNLLIADFPSPDRIVEFSDITALSKIILDDYQTKKIDHVSIFYNHFASTLKQEATQKQLLPIPADSSTDLETKKEVLNKKNTTNIEYKFEPDVKSILDTILPEILKIQMLQISLESNASEHSARMIAMKNATDNAADLIDDLTLTYNSIRQAAITKEISEISAGAEALRA